MSEALPTLRRPARAAEGPAAAAAAATPRKKRRKKRRATASCKRARGVLVALVGLATWSVLLLVAHDALRARAADQAPPRTPGNLRAGPQTPPASRDVDFVAANVGETDQDDILVDDDVGVDNDDDVRATHNELEVPDFKEEEPSSADQISENDDLVDLAAGDVDAHADAESPEVASLIDAADAERVIPVGAWQAGEGVPSPANSVGTGNTQRRAELVFFACKAIRDRVNWDPVEGKSHRRPKEAIILGTASIIQRDLQPVSQAYRLLGVKVEQASKLSAAVAHGRATGSLRSVRNRDWGVIICLSLSTEKCLSDADFVRLEADQAAFARVNRIAGLQEVLWSKDRYCATVKRSGAWVPAYTFSCWILPAERNGLLRYLAHKRPADTRPWIVKPFKQGGGKGIFVLDTNDELRALVTQDSRKLIVQPYLVNPHLLDGRKWDLRTYVLVTSVSPFARAYLFRDGLVRLATDRYNPNARHGGNKTQFLTNTSVNKRKEKNMDLLTWSFAKLEAELGFDRFQLLFARMRRAVGMLLVAAEAGFASYFEGLGPGFRCANCYHLLGVDLIVDAHLVPRVIEVNGEPSMQMSGAAQSHYDTTKSQMQQEVARIALKAQRGLPTRVAARLVHRCGVSDAQAQALARDEDMLAYLMNLDRESASAENFHLVYPDPDACGGGARAQLWDQFLEEVIASRPEAYQARRRLLHSLARRYLCV